MDLNEVFELRVTKFNLGQAFVSYRREFESYPTKEEMLEFIKELDKDYPDTVKFHTRLEVNKINVLIRF